MQLTANSNCTTLTGTFDSTVPMERYIENLQNDGLALQTVGICCYTLELSYNCCEPIRYPIRALLPLTLTLVDCDEAPPGFLSFELGGIDIDCVSRITYTNPLNVTVDVTNFQNAPILIELAYTGSQTAGFKIYTCDGMMYVLNVALSMTVGSVCSTSIISQTLVHPDLPDGVSVRQNTDGEWVYLDLAPEAFGLQPGAFPTGIYRASLYQDNIPLTDDTFVYCDLWCDVTTHLVNHPNSLIYNLVTALINSEACDNLTTEERCQLWSYIALELGYIRQHSDCGCNF